MRTPASIAGHPVHPMLVPIAIGCSLPAGRVKSTGLMHMGINLTVVAIYIVNGFLRHNDPQSLALPMILSAVTVPMLLVSGGLGGKLVFEHGVAVDTGGGR